MILFDLDNSIVRIPPPSKEEVPETPAETSSTTESGGKIIFYGADDEAETVEKQQADEERQRRLAEIESRTFGSPVFEHEGSIRFAPIDIDGEWDISAEAEEIDSDYFVDDDTVTSLQLEMKEVKT